MWQYYGYYQYLLLSYQRWQVSNLVSFLVSILRPLESPMCKFYTAWYFISLFNFCMSVRSECQFAVSAISCVQLYSQKFNASWESCRKYIYTRSTKVTRVLTTFCEVQKLSQSPFTWWEMKCAFVVFFFRSVSFECSHLYRCRILEKTVSFDFKTIKLFFKASSKFYELDFCNRNTQPHVKKYSNFANKKRWIKTHARARARNP